MSGDAPPSFGQAAPGRRAARRAQRRLDPRFAAYLIGQVAAPLDPAPIAITAAYRLCARDLGRPRTGVLTDETA